MTAVAPRLVGYRRAHDLVVESFGPASSWRCFVDGCPSAAQSWAYQHSAGEAELTELRGGSLLRYATTELGKHYRPACFCHHVRLGTLARTGRCKREEAEQFVLDFIDRHGQFLLSRRIYAEADALGIDRFTLRAVRDRFGIESRMFHNVDGAGSVAVWLVPDEAVPPPGQRKSGTS